MQEIIDSVDVILKNIKDLEEKEQIETINKLSVLLNSYTRFKTEPVNCIQWVPFDSVRANDYNPNSVAPPEMELLKVSISEDGYTQPIVTWKLEDGTYEVIDGFHRNRVGRECKEISEKLNGYLPVVVVNDERLDRGDRIASTIRHNRARGKHKIDSMSDIVVELKRRNWSDDRICKNLGMEPDEVLRLCQITGLSELFSDQEFSASWDVDGEVTESEIFEQLTDDITTYGEESEKFRTVNTSDENRVFHTYEKWECYKAGLYNTVKEGMKKNECQEAYRDFLSDTDKFAETLEHVITEWKCSCEHYLSNVAMNRIAWLGQASACYALGIPAVFRGGWQLLTDQQQTEANETALVYLNKWLIANGHNEITMDEANSGRQSDIY